MDNQNTQINNQQKKAKSLFSGPKIVFLILGAIIVLEIIYAIGVLRSPAAPSPEQQSLLPREVALMLFSSKSQYKIGEVVAVLVQVDTGNRATEGVDLVLNFDPKVLEASQGAIVKGAIYPEYPQMKTDAKLGQIQISGISGLQGKSFKGQGNFATINFKAKAPGDVNLTVGFSPGQTDDSNVVEALSGNDILETVANLNLAVQ